MWNQWAAVGAPLPPTTAPPQPAAAPPLPDAPPPAPATAPPSLTAIAPPLIGPSLPTAMFGASVMPAVPSLGDSAGLDASNPYTQYTVAQYAAMTADQQYALQQHWQQWQAYQQEYAKWHEQYGEQYKREMASATPISTSSATGYTNFFQQQQPPPPPPDDSQLKQQQQQQLSSVKISGQPQIYTQPPPPMLQQPPPPQQLQQQTQTLNHQLPQVQYFQPLHNMSQQPPPAFNNRQQQHQTPTMQNRATSENSGNGGGGRNVNNSELTNNNRNVRNIGRDGQNQCEPDARNRSGNFGTAQSVDTSRNSFDANRDLRNQWGGAPNEGNMVSGVSDRATQQLRNIIQRPLDSSSENRFRRSDSFGRTSQDGVDNLTPNPSGNFQRGSNQNNSRNNFSNDGNVGSGEQNNFNRNSGNFGVNINNIQRNNSRHQDDNGPNARDRNVSNNWNNNDSNQFRNNYGNQSHRESDRWGPGQNNGQRHSTGSNNESGNRWSSNKSDENFGGFRQTGNNNNNNNSGGPNRWGNQQGGNSDGNRNQGQNNNFGLNQNQRNWGSDGPMPGAVNRQQQQRAPDIDEEGFDLQFQKWQQQFEDWKRANANIQDREFYNRYEQEFERQRQRITERREQMRQRKMTQMGKMSSEQDKPNQHLSQTMPVVNQEPLQKRQDDKQPASERSPHQENMELSGGMSCEQVAMEAAGAKVHNLEQESNQHNRLPNNPKNTKTNQMIAPNTIDEAENKNTQNPKESTEPEIEGAVDSGVRAAVPESAPSERAGLKRKSRFDPVHVKKTVPNVTDTGAVISLDDDDDDCPADEQEYNETMTGIFEKSEGIPGLDLVGTEGAKRNDEQFEEGTDGPTRPPKIATSGSPTKKIPSLFDIIIEKPPFSPSGDGGVQSSDQYADEQTVEPTVSNAAAPVNIPDVANALKDPEFLQKITLALAKAQGKDQSDTGLQQPTVQQQVEQQKNNDSADGTHDASFDDSLNNDRPMSFAEWQRRKVQQSNVNIARPMRVHAPIPGDNGQNICSDDPNSGNFRSNFNGSNEPENNFSDNGPNGGMFRMNNGGGSGPNFDGNGPNFGRMGPNGPFRGNMPNFGNFGGGNGPNFGGRQSEYCDNGPNFGGPNFRGNGPFFRQNFGGDGPNFGGNGPNFGGSNSGGNLRNYGNNGPNFNANMNNESNFNNSMNSNPFRRSGGSIASGFNEENSSGARRSFGGRSIGSGNGGNHFNPSTINGPPANREDDGFFRPMQVIDYTQSTMTPKVIDYGHKQTVAVAASGGGSAVSTEKDEEFRPVQTFDYDHSMSRRPSGSSAANKMQPFAAPNQFQMNTNPNTNLNHYKKNKKNKNNYKPNPNGSGNQFTQRGQSQQRQQQQSNQQQQKMHQQQQEQQQLHMQKPNSLNPEQVERNQIEQNQQKYNEKEKTEQEQQQEQQVQQCKANNQTEVVIGEGQQSVECLKNSNNSVGDKDEGLEEISDTEDMPEFYDEHNEENASPAAPSPPMFSSHMTYIPVQRISSGTVATAIFPSTADANRAAAAAAATNKRSMQLSQMSIPTIENKNTISVDEILMAPGRYTRPKRICIILRGPPGSGKSYVAKLIKEKESEMGGKSTRILSIDDYFVIENDYEERCPKTGKKIPKTEILYEYDGEMEYTYMQYLIKLFKKTISDSLYDLIIIDCNNNSLRTLNEFYCLSKDSGFMPYIVDLLCDEETCMSRNVHERNAKDIRDIISCWNPTPFHYIKLDVTPLLENVVEMEDADDMVTDNDFNNEMVDGSGIIAGVQASGGDADAGKADEEDSNEAGETAASCGFLKSKWENDTTSENLARLDGTSKRFTKHKPTTMEDYLQIDDWEPPRTITNGKKRVRWADIEEKRAQEKMRAIGFVVGQTDWKRMMDPNAGNRALNKTKYIERVNKRR